jgi:hypothetical protein
MSANYLLFGPGRSALMESNYRYSGKQPFRQGSALVADTISRVLYRQPATALSL